MENFLIGVVMSTNSYSKSTQLKVDNLVLITENEFHVLPL